MARHDIRGLKLSDGTYSLTSKDVYNLNDNFIQLSQEVFGNSNFTKKIEKQVLKNVKDIEAITYRVTDAEGGINDLEFTATSLINRISDAEGNVSTLQNTAQGLTNRVSDAEGNISTLQNTTQGLAIDIAATDGRALNAQATADAVTLSFTNQKIGTRNLIKGSQEHFRSLNAGIYATSVGESVLLSEHSISIGDKVTFSVWILAPYSIGAMARLDFANSSGGTIEAHFGNVISGGQDGLSHVTATVPPGTTSIGINIASEAYGVSESTVQIRKEKLEEGTKPTAWLPHHNEIKTLTHVFDNTGYTIKDSNGAELMSLSKGVANEQNIGRVDNVEAGYPMKIPFHIGSEVSQITQAVLKWDISKFRTYSKGAASGGGTKTTPSGGGGTTGTRWGSTGIAVGTSGTTASTGLPHNHTVSLDDLSHSHSTPSHTHSMDITHSHDPVYGILEPNIVDYVFTVYVDGVLRATLNAQRGEVDLSAWITTSGWHEVRLQVNNLMRIDANLFLKTYIRR